MCLTYIGLEPTLSQVDEWSDEHPIAFVSRKLLAREKSYATAEMEYLAIVWALQSFQVCLYAQEFLVQTDHQPLPWLHCRKTESSTDTVGYGHTAVPFYSGTP